MKDLWQIVLLYIRCFDILEFEKSFLTQLVCFNHKLLSTVEMYRQMSKRMDSALYDHILQ